MVGIDSEIGEKKGFPARLVASAVRFYGHEDRVNLCQGFGIIEFQNPALLGSIVFVENAQIQRLLKVGATTSPCLKCLWRAWLAVDQDRRHKRSETFPLCRTGDRRACG